MLFTRSCLFARLSLLAAVGGLMTFSQAEHADAQIVRRFAGGGVQVNAPFVRVNVGPGGATSVRAPFTAVNSPGRIFLGRRRRLMAQPQPTGSQQRRPSSQKQSTPQQPAAKQPDIADVDALSYPTAEQLGQMNDKDLIETLRQMTARLHHRLSLLSTGEGWQTYLVLSREILGSPGAPPAAARFDSIRDVLPRYQSVQDDPQFAKIAGLPSFVATFAALQEADRRANKFEQPGPAFDNPSGNTPNGSTSNNKLELNSAAPPTEQHLETLPTPEPTAVKPNATRGERSILKRK